MGAFAALDDHVGPWSFEAFVELGELPSWPRVELIEGSLLVSPHATVRHQQVCGELHFLIRLAIAGLPLRVYSPANLAIPSLTSMPIPDVVVAHVDDNPGLAVAAEQALLLVEVESPSTRFHDRVTKAHVYAKAGIAHYWRVELPEAGDPVVCRHELEGDIYRLVEQVAAGQTLSVTEPFAVRFDPGSLIGGDGVPG
jgi:Uma2 family endonuclease